jgi:hypothetical protein
LRDRGSVDQFANNPVSPITFWCQYTSTVYSVCCQTQILDVPACALRLGTGDFWFRMGSSSIDT